MLQKIKEGKAEVFVFEGEKISSELPVFYNPFMKVNRDFSTALVKVYRDEIKKPVRLLDGFSASGIAGIRYGLESLREEDEIVFNDKNPKAIELIEKNIELNKIKQKYQIRNQDVKKLLLEEKFDIIDIDPFGTPSPFIELAAISSKKNSLVLITSTDTAPLEGTYPLSCFRKYGIKSFRTHFSKELGIRILITAIIRDFAKHEKAFVPIFSLSHRHFFRVAGIVKSKGEIKNLLNNFGYLSYCEKCGRWYLDIEKQCKCGKKTKITGPLYLGNLWDENFVEKLEVEETKILNIIKEESKINIPFYYNTHKIYKGNVPKVEDIIERLRKEGYVASRTHFDPNGIRTNAELI